MTDRAQALKALKKVAAKDSGTRIADLFALEPDRLSRMSIDAAGLFIDLSKQNWSQEGLDALLDLAQVTGVESRRAALFAGEVVNETEGRASLHPALRAADGAGFWALGEPIMAEVSRARWAMADFVYEVRSGGVTGATRQPFQSIVHIGIGGSDLGPRLVWDALRPIEPALDLRFVANIDPREMAEMLSGLDPETTLFVIASKTFTTQETLANAEAARDWLSEAVPEKGLSRHLVGVTAAPDRADAFGCGRTFAFGDWIGGRYSLWSAVGLSTAIALGWDIFERMLEGARTMDAHFLSAPLAVNAPVLMALAQVYNVEGLGRQARTVAPYAYGLRRLPAYLKQLEMESNGKGVKRDGSSLDTATGPIVFGEAGTNAQHAFFQQIHQGPVVVPAEFIVVGRTLGDQLQPPLWANALAQARALMVGRTVDQAEAEMVASGVPAEEAIRLAPHRAFAGNRPSTTILMDSLSPELLGALIALYEHKTFVEGVIWDINSFDQWGVELGKQLARTILDDVAHGAPSAEADASTQELLKRLML